MSSRCVVLRHVEVHPHGGGTLRNSRGEFLSDLLEQIHAAVAVAPLVVVVPADELEEGAVQLDAAASVEDAGTDIVNEIGRDDFVFRVAQNSFEIGLAGRLHCRADFFVACRFGRLDREVNDGDGRRRNPEGHAGELALDFGADKADRLRGAVVLGMMLMAAVRPPFQSLRDGPSTVFCVAV